MRGPGMELREAIRTVLRVLDETAIGGSVTVVPDGMHRGDFAQAMTTLRRFVSGEVLQRGWEPGQSVRLVPGAKDRGI